MCTGCVLYRSELVGQISTIYSVFQDQAEQVIRQHEIGIGGVFDNAEDMVGLVAMHMYLKRLLHKEVLQLSEAQDTLQDIEDEMVSSFVPAPSPPRSPTANSRCQL